ncbi:MAG: MMPL family transporter [Terrimicrobiaceae bacterium]
MVADFIARLAVRHPLRLLIPLVMAVGLSVFMLVRGPGFDSDILNLLPDGNHAVEGLRQYEREFTQARELAFVLEWDQPPADPEGAREDFAEALESQPWVVRVLAGSPLGSKEILAPLLMNLPAGDFLKFLESLKPGPLGERLRRLADSSAAGSPLAAFELKQDPLGLAAAALRPVMASTSLDQAFDLATVDGRLAVVPCVTDQTDLSPEGCRAMMEKVRTFIASYRYREGDSEIAGPHISVTGRSAYVVEVSTGMERDIRMTSAVSLSAVVLLFWLGFRRLLPLAGIALLLAVAAIFSTALGLAVFGPLNVVAIGFCSILFGLGDDFSLLVCQRYATAAADGLSREQSIAAALRKAGPGIGWVSLTTALGFLALIFAGSTGFRQLGVMVAMGVMIAAGLMLTVLPVFLRGSVSATSPGSNRIPRWLLRFPGRVFGAGLVLATAAAWLAMAPWRPLSFDLSPSSLEPRNTEASRALSKIMTGLPGSFEPVIVLLENPTPERLAVLDQALEDLKVSGRALSTSSPTPLILNEKRAAQNVATMNAMAWESLHEGILKAGDAAGLSDGALQEALQTLDAAASMKPSDRWQSHLPKSSPWWFLLDRMGSPDGGVAAAQIQVMPSMTPEQRREMAAGLETFPGLRVTGWSQSLASLVPWAQSELLIFGGCVLGLIAVVLLFVYHDLRLWLLHMGSLVASAALAGAALKLVDVPINLLNVLAVPLVLGVGVDYGTHIILAVREGSDPLVPLRDVLKPVLLSGLTTIAGFGALVLAVNPALSGLGWTCSLGVGSCLAAAFLIIAPGAVLLTRRRTSCQSA